MSTDAHIYHQTWPAVIKVLIQRFFTKNVPQNLHIIVTQASQLPDKVNLDFVTQIFKIKRRCRHSFTVIQKTSYYVRGLKSSICEMMLEKLWGMPPKVYSSLIDIGRIAVAEERSQQVLMKYTQPRQSMNIKTCKIGLPTFLLGDTPVPSSTGSNLPKNKV